MKLHKKLIIIGTLIALITLLISFILILCNYDNDQIICFWSNVSLAVFGSSVVMVVTSIVGYLSERKRYELQYATFMRDFLLRIVRFIDIYNNTKVDPKEINSNASTLHTYYDSFAYEKDFDIYGYFFKNGKKRYLMKQLHNKSNEYAHEISRIESISRNALHNNESLIFQTNITVDMLDDTMDLVNQLFQD